MKKIIATMAMLISTSVMAWQPTKTIEVTIPWPAGSGNDLIFRPLARVVEQEQNVKFIIMNKPGAGGTVGTIPFLREPNDGHHINISSIGGLAAMDHAFPAFVKNAPYDIDSFSYATVLGYSAIVIIANINDPVSNLQELVKEITSDQAVTMGDSGGAGRLTTESFLMGLDARKKNPKLIRVEHKGPTETLTNVAGGHVRFGSIPLSVALSQVRAGTIKIIATSTKNRIPGMENVSPINTVIKDFEVLAGPWSIILPQGASKEVLDWYSIVFAKAAENPKIKEYFAQNYFFTYPGLRDPGKFKEYVYKERARNKPVIKFIVDSAK